MSYAGIQKEDITPPIGMKFIGYHRPHGIKGILDRLYVTACVLELNGYKSVIISIDNAGMLTEETTRLRNQVSEAVDVAVEQVTIVFTHTHSGPETVSDDPVVLDYVKTLREQTVLAVKKANEKLTPCEVGWGVTNGNIGMNRREMGPNGTVKMGSDPDGIVDRRIGVLSIKKKDADELLGAMVFCTAHPNVLRGDSLVVSADYLGPTREILEPALGCPVMIIQGAAGNVNARWRGERKDLYKMGMALAGHVLTIIPAIKHQPIRTLSTVSDTLHMQLKGIPEPSEIEHLALLTEKEWEVDTTRWMENLLQLHNSGHKQLSLELEVQLFQINEGLFAGIPMEPFSEIAIAIKDRLENDLAFFGGYTNGYLGYLPTREAFPYGGYEVVLNPVVYGPLTGLWMPPQENTSELVANKVVELAQRIKT